MWRWVDAENVPIRTLKVSRKRAKIGARAGPIWHYVAQERPLHARAYMRVRRTSGIATSCHPGPDVVTDAGLRVEEVRGSLDQVGVYVVVVPVDWKSRRGLRHQRGSTVSDGSCHVQISAVAHDHGECHESDDNAFLMRS